MKALLALFLSSVVLIYPVLLFPQSVEIKPVRLKSHTHSKILGIHDTTLLAMTSKQKSKDNFLNRPFICDSSMSFKDEKNTFFSSKPCSDEWTFFLKDKVYMAHLYSSDLKSLQRFYIKTVLFMNGVAQDISTDIFKIESSKDGKLNSQKSVFECVKGIHDKKVIFTYNNDYREEYSEGFIFRIMNEEGTISETDSLILPYSDRICNINDLVYDDIHDKIYLTSEHYVIKKEKKKGFRVRDFMSVFTFDIPTGKLIESNPVYLPDSSRVQFTVSDSSIHLFVVPDKNKINESDSVMLFQFKKQNPLMSSFRVSHFDSTFISQLNRNDSSYLFKNYTPVDFVAVNDTSVVCLLEYRYDGNAQQSSDAVAGVVAGAVAANVVSAMMGFGFFFIPTGYTYLIRFSSDLVVLKMDVSGKLHSNIIKKMSTPWIEGISSIVRITASNSVHFIYNDFAWDKKRKKYSYVVDTSLNLSSGEINVDSSLFSRKHIFLINPNSLYQKDEKNYFIGNFMKEIVDEFSETEFEKSFGIIRYRPD